MVKVVRLWWRCSLCRRRFDLWGVDHGERDDRFAAGRELLDHLRVKHGVDPSTLTEAAACAKPDGKTNRIVARRTLVTL